MLLAQSRYWRAVLSRGRDAVAIGLDRDQLPDELQDLKDPRFEVPLGRWNVVVKHAESDRKLLGGILLDVAAQKETVAKVVASDRLLADLQRVMRDATVALVEAELLVLAPPAAEEG
jgi:hypothetical protein